MDDGSPISATRFESKRGIRLGRCWRNLQQYPRGAFWGNALSDTHRRHLGGRNRVLAEAPVWRAEPLGEGVWLQLSSAMPPAPEEIDRLEAYFAPILAWSATEVEECRREYAAARDAYYQAKPIATVPEERRRQVHDGLPPVVWLDPPEPGDTIVNMHFDHVLDAEGKREIASILQGWFAEAVSGGVPYHFSEMSEPAIVGEVARCWVDTHTIDGPINPIIERLRAWAASARLARPTEIVVGMETVGD